MIMARLQLQAALLCLFFFFTSAAIDLEDMAQIRKDVAALEKEQTDIAKRFVSTRDFRNNVLDKGLELVEQMKEMVQEYGLEGEFPSVAKFVENLKIYMDDTKTFATGHMDKLVDEYEVKDEEIKELLLKLLKAYNL